MKNLILNLRVRLALWIYPKEVRKLQKAAALGMAYGGPPTIKGDPYLHIAEDVFRSARNNLVPESFQKRTNFDGVENPIPEWQR